MNKLIKIIILIIFVSSCSSKKDIVYLQGQEDYVPSEFEYIDHKIDKNDILKINVYTVNPVLSAQYNSFDSEFSVNSTEILKINGYQVNNDGNINFPVIGIIHVKDLTISELEDKIYNILLSSEQLQNHSVSVKLLNAHFTVLGEVNKPGTYDFIENNLNILRAIGLAGDLTINGKRNDIKIIRNIKGKSHISQIDLTKTDYLNTEFFQIKSGDIIIVNPNTNRIKNAGIIGNSGTLLSLLSFLLTSIIVINN